MGAVEVVSRISLTKEHQLFSFFLGGEPHEELSGPISRDIVIVSLRYPISRDTFLRGVRTPPNGVILRFATYRAIIVRYPMKQARKSLAILSLQASRDMKSIAAGPLR